MTGNTRHGGLTIPLTRRFAAQCVVFVFFAVLIWSGIYGERLDGLQAAFLAIAPAILLTKWIST